MKLTDYVAFFLRRQKIDTVFGLTGGAAVHFFDSIEKTKGIKAIFCHHEQAAALAAVAYARVKNSLGAAIFTTGPGGTNAVTGVVSAWQDSIPTIFISGQARKEHTSHGKGLRQLGVQELDIISIVKSVTKYAVMLDSPENIRYELEKALFIAQSGRPGPVWIDIPLNYQWMDVDPRKLRAFRPPKAPTNFSAIEQKVSQCQKLIHQAKRPLVLVGYGVRLAHAEQEFKRFIDRYRLPFVSSWTASDFLPTACPSYVGRIGVFGQRGANLAIQNCDLLLVLGSHLSIPLTGTMFHAFAREAKIVVVNIDPKELDFRTVRVDVPICCDARSFLSQICKGQRLQPLVRQGWGRKLSIYRQYNEVPKDYFHQKHLINSYVFVDVLSDSLSGDEVVVVDGGGANLFTSFQAFKVKGHQRLTVSSGICAMGTGLPESVGASWARPKKNIICLCGDGSMQLNIHELQTIVHHCLPVKIFVINNGGYLAIRHTQQEFLGSRYVGSGPQGGLSLPDFVKVAKAYGMKAARVHRHCDLSAAIKRSLRSSGPFLCEIMVAEDQPVYPRVGFAKSPDGTFSPLPLEDMYPPLPPQELRSNMFVAPYIPRKK